MNCTNIERHIAAEHSPDLLLAVLSRQFALHEILLAITYDGLLLRLFQVKWISLIGSPEQRSTTSERHNSLTARNTGKPVAGYE